MQTKTHLVNRILYGPFQISRISWYLFHHIASQRTSFKRIKNKNTKLNLPTIRDLLFDISKVFYKEFKDINNCIYNVPLNVDMNPFPSILKSKQYFDDLNNVNFRRLVNDSHDIPFNIKNSKKFPEYYKRSYHNQTDGYFSIKSAKLYDHQVETLFLGSADVMRRRTLPYIYSYLKNTKEKKICLLDIGSGTNRLINQINDNWPEIFSISLDLSLEYLKFSRQISANATNSVQGLAENLPIKNNSQDIILCTYVFHELPKEIRLQVAKECSRTLKKNGLLVFLDSIQINDCSKYNDLIKIFPTLLHEPYYNNYINNNLSSFFSNDKLKLINTSREFLSKIMVYKKVK